MLHQRRFTAIQLILIPFFALACLYACAVPIFEAPDESTHMAVIDHIASTGELPVQVVGQKTPWAQEGSQPPLYFMLGKPIARLFDRRDFPDLLRANPHAIIGDPGAGGNKNHFLHDGDQSPFVSGSAGTVYALRLFIRLVDVNDEPLTVLPTFPGYGRLRTSAWQPGYIYADSYAPKLPDQRAGAFGLRAYVGWWKFPDGYSIDPTDESGQPVNLVFLDAGAYVNTADTPKLAQPVVPVPFGDMIALVGYSLDGDVLSLLWQAIGVPDVDYTVMAVVFAHDLTPGEENHLVAQGDSPPELPTHYWMPGDRFITRHRLDGADSLAPGSYPVYVGWYNLATMQRLPTISPDNAYRLTAMDVS